MVQRNCPEVFRNSRLPCWAGVAQASVLEADEATYVTEDSAAHLDVSDTSNLANN
jgi:hypothetical protein